MSSDEDRHYHGKAKNKEFVKVAESADLSNVPSYAATASEFEGEEDFKYDDSQKIGITGAVFLILNKMIGTGIFSTPSGIFANTGSVGVCLFLWVIGYVPLFSLHSVI